MPSTVYGLPLWVAALLGASILIATGYVLAGCFAILNEWEKQKEKRNEENIHRTNGSFFGRKPRHYRSSYQIQQKLQGL